MYILIVDDSLGQTVILQNLLKKVGYEDFLIATSAKGAFEILGANDPKKTPEVGLILMDVTMPGMTGIEACRIIKSTEHLRDIPIIMVTAKTDVNSLKLAFSAGALDYILKPVRAPELLARVHSAIRLKQEMDTRKARERELTEANRQLKIATDESDKLLNNILPAKIANDLKYKGRTKPKLFKDVTVFFSDIEHFTKISAMLDPESLIEELNDMFTAFDNIMEENGCERIKTIGDAYLAVCGMPDKNPRHAECIGNAALEIVDYLRKRNEENLIKWKVRIGMNSGSVIGSVVGVKKYIYDVFGDTVNTASRMEEQSEPLKINVSEATQSLLTNNFDCVEREPVMIKGKGIMRMFFLERQ